LKSDNAGASDDEPFTGANDCDVLAQDVARSASAQRSEAAIFVFIYSISSFSSRNDRQLSGVGQGFVKKL
jgi:hypothetical protein